MHNNIKFTKSYGWKITVRPSPMRPKWTTPQASRPNAKHDMSTLRIFMGSCDIIAKPSYTIIQHQRCPTWH